MKTPSILMTLLIALGSHSLIAQTLTAGVGANYANFESVISQDKRFDFIGFSYQLQLSFKNGIAISFGEHFYWTAESLRVASETGKVQVHSLDVTKHFNSWNKGLNLGAGVQHSRYESDLAGEFGVTNREGIGVLASAAYAFPICSHLAIQPKYTFHATRFVVQDRNVANHILSISAIFRILEK